MNGDVRFLDPIDGMEAATAEKMEALRELQDYDDWEESTARTEVHVNLQSHPDITRPKSEPPAKVGPFVIVYTVAKKFTALGALVIALALIAAYVYLASIGKAPF
jgi:hypothetical protein